MSVLRSGAVLAVLAAGCFNPTYNRPACGENETCPSGLSCDHGFCVDLAIDDAGGDGSSPVDGCVTFSTQLDTCALGVGQDLMITGNRIYNTDTRILEDVGGGNTVPVNQARVTRGGDMMEVLVTGRFTLSSGATLRVVGSVPFGIVASGVVAIDGVLIATGNGLGAAGARDRATCAGLAGTTAANDNGGSPGGGGGGFQGTGGKGGLGDANGGPTPGGSGGAMEAMPTGFPKGGCPGGDGGNNLQNNGHGIAGLGGGAVDIISAISIGIAGGINAGGSGGTGGPPTDGGGGGGGAGGMIILEAPIVAGSGGVAANGGGGGGGGGNDASGSGATGSVSMTATNGGTKADSGSNGGDGGAGSGLPGRDVTTTNNSGGGGGGGGGAGYIRVIGTTPTLAVISPAPS